MSGEINKNKLIEILEVIVEMTANIVNEERNAHQIEIDLLAEETRKFYKEILSLNDHSNKRDNIFQKTSEFSNVKSQKTAPVKGTEVKKTEEKNIVKENIVAEENIAKENIVEENVVENSIVEESIIEEKNATPTEIAPENITERSNAQIIADDTKEKMSSKTFAEAVTLADKLKKDDNTINRQMANSNLPRNQAFTETPISNLRNAIGINDKFMFVNELFKGDMKEYDNFIAQVNNASGYNEAISMLDEALIKFDSVNKNDAVKKLKDFISRRFQ